MNAELIHMGLSQGERLTRLNAIAIRQMQVLTSARRLSNSGDNPGLMPKMLYLVQVSDKDLIMK
jgi:hypothetical protein